MKPLSCLVAIYLLAHPAFSTVAAQSPSSSHQPPAYLTGSLSLDPQGESVVALRGALEVAWGRLARPWAAAGYWALAGRGCLPISGPGIPPCDTHVSGALIEAGVDALPLPASLPVQPFVGAGVGVHFRTNGERMLWPILRAGVDLQPWPWVAPRAQIEWSRYPEGGKVLLLTAGLRIGLPLR